MAWHSWKYIHQIVLLELISFHECSSECSNRRARILRRAYYGFQMLKQSGGSYRLARPTFPDRCVITRFDRQSNTQRTLKKMDARVKPGMTVTVIASEAKQSRAARKSWIASSLRSSQ
jgi:hypothetical protein